MSRLARLFIPAVAASVALAATAPLVADLALARPDRPDFRPGPGGRDEARLRAEIQHLRTELGHYQAAHAELSAGLDRIAGINRTNRDRRSMTQISRAISDARGRAAQHVQPWDQQQQQPGWRDRPDWRILPAPPPPPAPPGHVRDRRTPPPSIAIMPMSDHQFASLTQQVGQAPFSDDKLALIQTAAHSNYFTVTQVVQLMKLASFDDTRVEIAVACSPRVVDGERWFEVYGALSFSSSREALRRRVGR